LIKSTIHTAVAATLVAMGAAGSAQAVAPVLALDGYEITITNYDSATTLYTGACTTVGTCDAAGSPALGSLGSVNGSADSMGIFSIDRITSTSTGKVVYRSGQGGTFLTGIFAGLLDYNVSGSTAVDGSTNYSIKALDGGIKVWANSTDYSSAPGPKVAAGVDLNAYQYAGISAGDLWLSGDFTPGAILGDTTTTYANAYNSKTLAGVGQGFIDITGGTAAGSFIKGLNDLNGVGRNLFLKATFSEATGFAADKGWSVSSGGVITSAVPEPTTLALAALGLVAVGSAARRSRT